MRIPPVTLRELLTGCGIVAGEPGRPLSGFIDGIKRVPVGFRNLVVISDLQL